MTTIAIPLFPRFTALDGIGPYEVLQRIPGYDVTFVGHERGVVRSDNGFLGIEVDATFEELPGPGRDRVPRAASAPARWSTTTSCSTGSAGRTRRRRSRRRCAPGRSCSPRPGCSTG